MKRDKLYYIVVMAVLAVILVATLIYKRPLDIQQLTGVAEPKEISVFLFRQNGDTDLEERMLSLSAGDEGFDPLLARLEEIQFRRPPTNLIRIVLPFSGLPGIFADEDTKEAEDGEFQSLTLYLSGTDESGESVSGKVTFEVDQWQYRNFDREVTLNLAVVDSKATGQALCAELWEMAQPVESNS